jgi:hypothetical protein
MKLLVILFSPISHHFNSLRTKYSPKHPALTFSLYFSLNVRNKVSRAYKTIGKSMVLYILTFMFLDSRQEDERFWIEW